MITRLEIKVRLIGGLSASWYQRRQIVAFEMVVRKATACVCEVPANSVLPVPTSSLHGVTRLTR